MEFINATCSWVAFGWAFVAAAARVAPAKKRVVAITFAGIAVFLSAFITIVAISARDWLGLLAVPMFIVGAVIGARTAPQAEPLRGRDLSRPPA